MIFEITDYNDGFDLEPTREKRTVGIDDEGFEWGEDKRGRKCRVAKHRIQNLALGTTVKTCGSIYKRIK